MFVFLQAAVTFKYVEFDENLAKDKIEEGRSFDKRLTFLKVTVNSMNHRQGNSQRVVLFYKSVYNYSATFERVESFVKA